ncbi:MAG: site-2 protease family protein [Thermoanaerobaculia bacterium]
MATNIATNIAGFVIVLGFLIFVHELGHFLVAKFFRVRVLVFSFGFGKRLFGFEKGGTDYRVSLIPLGGYVRMAGDAAEETREGSPDEFLSKPKWQRFLIMMAGPGANVFVAIAFLTWLNMAGVEVARESRAVLGKVVEGKPAAAAGLRAGDEIIAVDNDQIKGWDDLKLAISMNAGIPVRIKYLRNGSIQSTVLTPERIVTDYGTSGFAGLQGFVEPEVGKVYPDTAAALAGFKPGDRIVKAGGRPITQLGEFEDVLAENRGKTIPVTLERAGALIATTLPAMKMPKENYPGFALPSVMRKFGFAGAVRESLSQNWRMVRYTFITIARLFRLQGSVKDFSGPINIARISGEMLRTGWKAVVFLMASISLQLGIMNLLPIPVLDGGHIFILLVEGVRRRDLSMQVKETLLKVGFVALALLMIVVLSNDIIQNIVKLTKG